jgi:hypothetical protein
MIIKNNFFKPKTMYFTHDIDLERVSKETYDKHKDFRFEINDDSFREVEKEKYGIMFISVNKKDNEVDISHMKTLKSLKTAMTFARKVYFVYTNGSSPDDIKPSDIKISDKAKKDIEHFITRGTYDYLLLHHFGYDDDKILRLGNCYSWN